MEHLFIKGKKIVTDEDKPIATDQDLGMVKIGGGLDIDSLTGLLKLKDIEVVNVSIRVSGDTINNVDTYLTALNNDQTLKNCYNTNKVYVVKNTYNQSGYRKFNNTVIGILCCSTYQRETITQPVQTKQYYFDLVSGIICSRTLGPNGDVYGNFAQYAHRLSNNALTGSSQFTEANYKATQTGANKFIITTDSLRRVVGPKVLADLQTTNKDSLVDAINEILAKASPATVSSTGTVKPDGSTITVDNDGTIHAVGGGTSSVDERFINASLYTQIIANAQSETSTPISDVMITSDLKNALQNASINTMFQWGVKGPTERVVEIPSYISYTIDSNDSNITNLYIGFDWTNSQTRDTYEISISASYNATTDVVTASLYKAPKTTGGSGGETFTTVPISTDLGIGTNTTLEQIDKDIMEDLFNTLTDENILIVEYRGFKIPATFSRDSYVGESYSYNELRISGTDGSSVIDLVYNVYEEEGVTPNISCYGNFANLVTLPQLDDLYSDVHPQIFNLDAKAINDNYSYYPNSDTFTIVNTGTKNLSFDPTGPYYVSEELTSVNDTVVAELTVAYPEWDWDNTYIDAMIFCETYAGQYEPNLSMKLYINDELELSGSGGHNLGRKLKQGDVLRLEASFIGTPSNNVKVKFEYYWQAHHKDTTGTQSGFYNNLDRALTFVYDNIINNYNTNTNRAFRLNVQVPDQTDFNKVIGVVDCTQYTWAENVEVYPNVYYDELNLYSNIFKVGNTLKQLHIQAHYNSGSLNDRTYEILDVVDTYSIQKSITDIQQELWGLPQNWIDEGTYLDRPYTFRSIASIKNIHTSKSIKITMYSSALSDPWSTTLQPGGQMSVIDAGFDYDDMRATWNDPNETAPLSDIQESIYFKWS